MFNALILFTTMTMFQSPSVIFKFEPGVSTDGWQIVDDRVMGGRSLGLFVLNSESRGVFKGVVTTENNGGFSSLRYNFEALKTAGFESVVLKLKGDGKAYQFRLKSNSNDRHSYVYRFTTNGTLEEIVIPLKLFRPTFRGRALTLPNFDADALEQIAFLIGNKKEEDFELLIDSITLR